MKNQAKKLSVALVALFCMAISFSAKAINPPLPPGACDYKSSLAITNPYMVQNTFPCPVKIQWAIKKPGCTACTAPGGSGTMIIPASSAAPIPIPAACLPACDIGIKLIDIGGAPLTFPIGVSSATPHSSNACNTCGCGGAPTTYVMDWSPGITVIHP